ncbi:MAG: type IV secretory system conjugative DNA transfer family protein, partial [Planctomycetota bacterium]
VFQWVRCESFIKQLSSVSHRMLFEIAGNRDNISLTLGCDRADLPNIRIAFEAKVEHCMITSQRKAVFDLSSDIVWTGTVLRDYLPEPPYHHLLTRPDELQDSPLEGIIAALIQILPPAVGVYQVLFQPVQPDHDWHQNVQLLTDLEYLGKQIGNLGIIQRYTQQIPSGDLRHTAGKLESKAHNDKPFFFTALRVAVAGSDKTIADIQSLATPISLFQHGGRPLRFLTEKDYTQVLPPERIHPMLSKGLVYRPGFLLNSDELAGLVHVPPANLLERWDRALDFLEPLAGADTDLSEGIPIGEATIANGKQPVCVSSRVRRRHIHVIGRPDTGKSSLLESMIHHDIKQGHGVAVLDPHGDLVDRLLHLIPKEAVARTIYFNPGDPDWVPLWNPMSRIPGQDIGRASDDMVAVLKSFVTGWGDRMEHLLRHGIFGLKHIEHTSFLELSDVMRTGTNESKELHKLLLQVIQNEVAKQFWRYDYETYRADEFGPPRHKLSKLLVGGTSALMLSQPYSRFTFRQIMDEGMIFLADLSSNLGTEVRDILGGFILATIHATALGRRENREDFYVYLDEAHRFVTDCLEVMLVEARKFGVSLTLAHQYMRQFTRVQVDALASTGSTVAFNVSRQDAEYLSKQFQKTVKPDDFSALELRETLVRISTVMTKIRTLDRPTMPEPSFRDEIIEQSRHKYCLPVEKVQEMIRHRHRGSGQTFSPLVPPSTETSGGASSKERTYDEF